MSTSAERLNANGDQTLAIYDDLGTGASYGRYDVDTTRDNQWLTFPLNTTAVDALNSAPGFFSIGGRLLSIDRDSRTGGTQVLFGRTPLGASPNQLVVQTIPEPTCFGVPATIVGDDGDNVLVGTPDDDVIVGLGGNDTIYPQRGGDLVCAGAGNDHISDNPYASVDSPDLDVFEHSGDDAFSGGPGDDNVGNPQSNGADRLFGDDGNDYLSMGDGPMVGWGGRGADAFGNFGANNGLQMYGGPGDDSWREPFSSSQGNIGNRFFGGDGDDHVYMESASGVQVYGNRGNDTLEYQRRGLDGASNTVLDGGAGDDHLRGALESTPRSGVVRELTS